MRRNNIIMDGENVRGLRAGRKTMTRRIMNPQPQPPECMEYFERSDQPIELSGVYGLYRRIVQDKRLQRDLPPSESPYRVGDLIYVKETWRAWVDAEDGHWIVRYRADDTIHHTTCVFGDFFNEPPIEEPTTWRSPWFMPKWAARLWLRVTSKRAERLQEITEADVRAEGVTPCPTCGGMGYYEGGGNTLDCRCQTEAMPYAIQQFSIRWDFLNAKRGYSWESNPWVWVYGLALEEVEG